MGRVYERRMIMTKEEFMSSTKKLQDLYKKELNETQIEFWFDELERFSHEKYRRAIGEFAKKNKTMPSLAEILREINNLKPLNDDAPEVEIKTPCDTCHRYRSR